MSVQKVKNTEDSDIKALEIYMALGYSHENAEEVFNYIFGPKFNVILEGKTRIGKHWIEANGAEHKILKTHGTVFVKIESIETQNNILVHIEKDKYFNVKFI